MELVGDWRERVNDLALARPLPPLAWLILGFVCGAESYGDAPERQDVCDCLLVGPKEAGRAIEELRGLELIVDAIEPGWRPDGKED